MNTRPMGVIVLSMLAVVTGFVSVVSALALMGVAQFVPSLERVNITRLSPKLSTLPWFQIASNSSPR